MNCPYKNTFFIVYLSLFFSFSVCGSNVYGNTSIFNIDFQKELTDAGLVDIQKIDSTLKVDLKYSKCNNFMGKDVYGSFDKCYLQKDAAVKLVTASIILKQRYPGLSLLIVDGFRPQRIQWKMWQIVKNTPMQKYVAHPVFGSMHNYGCAVDLTIVDSLGNRLDMGTAIDHFGELSQPAYETNFLKLNKLNPTQIKNRLLLRDIMITAGFYPINIEWWHFEAFQKEYIRSNFKIIK